MPVLAQDGKTIKISIVSGTSRLIDTSYHQPNPVNFDVAYTIIWTNNDSAPHTVTDRIRSTSSNASAELDS
jgi:plastocyanin